MGAPAPTQWPPPPRGSAAVPCPLARASGSGSGSGALPRPCAPPPPSALHSAAAGSEWPALAVVRLRAPDGGGHQVGPRAATGPSGERTDGAAGGAASSTSPDAPSSSDSCLASPLPHRRWRGPSPPQICDVDGCRRRSLPRSAMWMAAAAPARGWPCAPPPSPPPCSAAPWPRPEVVSPPLLGLRWRGTASSRQQRQRRGSGLPSTACRRRNGGAAGAAAGRQWRRTWWWLVFLFIPKIICRVLVDTRQTLFAECPNIDPRQTCLCRPIYAVWGLPCAFGTRQMWRIR